MKKILSPNAFTLVELLIVMAIIGVMATFVMLSFGNPQKKARDAERQSDLKQYQAALTKFAGQNNGFYPARTSPVNLTSLCGVLGLPTSSCPDDPQGTNPYKYVSNGTAGTTSATEYTVWASVEVTEDFWQICSETQTGNGGIEPDGTTICTVGSVATPAGTPSETSTATATSTATSTPTPTPTPVCDDAICNEQCIAGGKTGGSCLGDLCRCNR